MSLEDSLIQRVREAMKAAVVVAEGLPEKFQGKAFELAALTFIGIDPAKPVGSLPGEGSEREKDLRLIARRLTLVEWVKLLRPTSGTQYAATIGAFAEYHDEAVLSLDYFRQALTKLGKRFANPSDVLLKAERSGWLYQDSGGRRLTSTALAWVRGRAVGSD